MRGTDTTSTASPGTIISGAEDCKYSQTEQILDPPVCILRNLLRSDGGVLMKSNKVGSTSRLTRYWNPDNSHTTQIFRFYSRKYSFQFKCTKDLGFISANLRPDEMKYWWCWGVSRFNHLPKAYLVWFMIIKPIWVVHLTRHAEIASTKWDQREAELVRHDRWPE